MTILRHTNGNFGGINTIKYLFKEDIASLIIGRDTLLATLVLKSGRVWKDLYGTPSTMQIESKEEPMPSGMKYNCQIKMMVPKDRIDAEVTLMQLNNRHLIISATDSNGVERYYGTLDCPMKKISKLIKPTNIEGYNGWEVVFSGDFSSPPAYPAIESGGVIDPPPDPIDDGGVVPDGDTVGTKA